MKWLSVAIVALALLGCESKKQDEFWNESTFKALIKGYCGDFIVTGDNYTHWSVDYPDRKGSADIDATHVPTKEEGDIDFKYSQHPVNNGVKRVITMVFDADYDDTWEKKLLKFNMRPLRVDTSVIVSSSGKIEPQKTKVDGSVAREPEIRKNAQPKKESKPNSSWLDRDL